VSYLVDSLKQQLLGSSSLDTDLLAVEIHIDRGDTWSFGQDGADRLFAASTGHGHGKVMGLLFCHLLIIYPGREGESQKERREDKKKGRNRKEGDTASSQ
jgi:hypothetical protein